MTEYSTDLQKLFLEMMLVDAQNYVRVQNIYNSENFDRSLRETAKFINEYSDKYKSLPSPEQIRATTGTELKIDHDMSQHNDWFITEFEQFTKRQELERAILKSADLLEKGDYGPVEKLIKDAVQISLQKDMGTDYFADPKGRLSQLKSNNGQNSTGWPSMDQKLYGGFKNIPLILGNVIEVKNTSSSENFQFFILPLILISLGPTFGLKVDLRFFKVSI